MNMTNRYLNLHYKSIYLTKYNNTRYHFMKDDYYIENDTLFGKGKLLSGDREEVLDRETTLSHIIALSDIVSIEVENFNLENTIYLSLGILGVAAAIGAAIFLIGMSNMNL